MIRIRGQQVSTALNRRVLSANTGRSVKPTANFDKPIELCVVDGKRVYRKSYLKKEFLFLMKSQREERPSGKFAGEGVSAVHECPDPPADTPGILSSSNKRKAGVDRLA
mmetsp:Transcript_13389/g.17533  ORF Transcript_13389/g.17533 Transcript_13389/m.17533 type:complete len:109 (+) Transcript_13389:701-1027(+)